MSSPFPFWHRRRLRWLNGLGFAITFFLALWFLMAVIASVRPNAEPVDIPYPSAYVAAALLALIAAVGLLAVIVFRFMWHGIHLDAFRPRVYVFMWTCAGVLFYVCLALMWMRFGRRPIPNIAPWAADVFWFLCPIGVFVFGALAYVNSDIPSQHEHFDDEGEHVEAEDHA